jgi:hypothetical protein
MNAIWVSWDGGAVSQKIVLQEGLTGDFPVAKFYIRAVS